MCLWCSGQAAAAAIVAARNHCDTAAEYWTKISDHSVHQWCYQYNPVNQWFTNKTQLTNALMKENFSIC